jgi:hypothetical protein
VLRIKTLILIVVVTTIADTVPFGMAFARTQPDQKAAHIPSDLLAAVQHDFKRDELQEANSCLEREGLSWDGILRATRFDRNAPRQVWLVEGLGPCLAGNANGVKLLYIRARNGWRKILDDFGQSLMVCSQAVPPCPTPYRSEPRTAGSRGWPDLALWHHGSANEGEETVYRFDGDVYKEIACYDVKYQSPDGKPYSKPRSTPCNVPPRFLAMLQIDLEHKKYLEHLKSCPEAEENNLPSNENVRIWWFDLNQYNLNWPEQGLVVQPSHPCPGKIDGEMFLFIRTGKSWRAILHTTGDTLVVDKQSDPWCPVPSASRGRSNSTQGWPDLIIAQNISPTERRNVCFRFDGNVYQEMK